MKKTQGERLAAHAKKRTNKHWSEADVKLLVEKYPNYSTRELAKDMDRSEIAVQRMASILGIKKDKSFLSHIRKINACKPDSKAFFYRYKPRHGRSMSKGPGSIYNVWSSMIARCEYKKHKSYESYGGAGVLVCKEWRNSFEQFLKDMGERPPGTTLDRWPNRSGNYEPGNCRWATHKEQARNRSNNLYLEAFGRKKLICEWCEEYKIAQDTLKLRLKKGMSPEAALTKPLQMTGLRIRYEKEGRYATAA